MDMIQSFQIFTASSASLPFLAGGKGGGWLHPGPTGKGLRWLMSAEISPSASSGSQSKYLATVLNAQSSSQSRLRTSDQCASYYYSMLLRNPTSLTQSHGHQSHIGGNEATVGLHSRSHGKVHPNVRPHCHWFGESLCSSWLARAPAPPNCIQARIVCAQLLRAEASITPPHLR